MSRISIGLPVFNGERFIEAAIQSLLAQTAGDFELLISDNASTDNTEEICRRFASLDSRVSYVRIDSNLGAARNFNLTFQRASGEYFKWAAADDLCEPSYFERCLQVLDNDARVVLCHARAKEIDACGKHQQTYEFPLRADADEAYVRFRELVTKPHPATAVFGLIRREILARTGLIGNFVSSDRALLAHLALYGKFYEIDEPLFLRRVHADNSIWLSKRSTLLSWYDPSQDGRIHFPHWRLATEYAKVTRIAPMKTSDRLRCLAAIAAYAKVKRGDLLTDLTDGARRYAFRSRAVKRLANRFRLLRRTLVQKSE